MAPSNLVTVAKVRLVYMKLKKVENSHTLYFLVHCDRYQLILDSSI